MKTYPIIHEHTDLTIEDLRSFVVKTANLLTDASINHYPYADTTTIEYIKFKMTIDRLGIDLVLFGMAVVENKRYLHLPTLKGNIFLIKHNFPESNHINVISNMFGVFQSFYDCIKKALLELECYEIIIILDRKYKSIIRVFKEEINI